jgi:hypothetical protein
MFTHFIPLRLSKIVAGKGHLLILYKSLKILLTNEKSAHFFINKRRLFPDKKNIGIIETMDRLCRAHKKTPRDTARGVVLKIQFQ